MYILKFFDLRTPIKYGNINLDIAIVALVYACMYYYNAHVLLHSVSMEFLSLVLSRANWKQNRRAKMVTIQIFTPESFSFMNPEEWPKWIGRFERYHLASGLSNKSTEIQVNTLIYHMGRLLGFSLGLILSCYGQ